MIEPLIALAILLGAMDETTESLLGAIPDWVFVLIFIVAFIGLLIFSLTNWRCPACNKYLGKALNPRICSKCGVALR